MESRKTIITVFVCFTFLSLLLWGYSKNGNTAASVQGVSSADARGALISPEAFFDFGAISMKDGDVTKDFTITNPTGENVTILGLETSCMCTSVLLVLPDGSTKGPFGMAGMGGLTRTNETVKAGESRMLRVIYNPNAHGPAGVGQIDRFVTVTDSSGATLRFEIKALVTP